MHSSMMFAGLLLAPSLGLPIPSVESRVKQLEEQFASFRRTHDEAPGELRLFNNDTCPPGWVEAEVTRGYVLVSRPKDASAGVVLNSPLANGERWRVGPHTHDATVSDPGHAHDIDDPGHSHIVQFQSFSGAPNPGSYEHTGAGGTHTDSSTTGISIKSTKSGVGVTVEAAKSEGYPLAYVLLCQRNANV